MCVCVCMYVCVYLYNPVQYTYTHTFIHPYIVIQSHKVTNQCIITGRKTEQIQTITASNSQ